VIHNVVSADGTVVHNDICHNTSTFVQNNKLTVTIRTKLWDQVQSQLFINFTSILFMSQRV